MNSYNKIQNEEKYSTNVNLNYKTEREINQRCDSREYIYNVQDYPLKKTPPHNFSFYKIYKYID